MSGDAAEQFNIHDAKTNLSRIIERVEHGGEIIISRAGRPVAKVIPLAGRPRRRARQVRHHHVVGEYALSPGRDGLHRASAACQRSPRSCVTRSITPGTCGWQACTTAGGSAGPPRSGPTSSKSSPLC